MTVIEELRAQSIQVRKEWKEKRAQERRIDIQTKIYSALKEAVAEGSSSAYVDFECGTNVKDIVDYLKSLGFNLKDDCWIHAYWFDTAIFDKNRIVPSRKTPNLTKFKLGLKIY